MTDLVASDTFRRALSQSGFSQLKLKNPLFIEQAANISFIKIDHDA